MYKLKSAIILTFCFLASACLGNSILFVSPTGELYVLVNNPEGNEIVIAKFDNTGKLDLSFGERGRARFSPSRDTSSKQSFYVPSFKVTEKGEVFVLGQPVPWRSEREWDAPQQFDAKKAGALFVTKLTPRGALADYGAGGSGTQWYKGFPYGTLAHGLEIDPQGNVYVAINKENNALFIESEEGHYVPRSSHSTSHVIKINADGTRDVSYGEEFGVPIRSEIYGAKARVYRISEMKDAGNGKVTVTGLLEHEGQTGEGRSLKQPFSVEIGVEGKLTPISLASRGEQALVEDHPLFGSNRFFPALGVDREAVWGLSLDFERNFSGGAWIHDFGWYNGSHFHGRLMNFTLPGLEMGPTLEQPNLPFFVPQNFSAEAVTTIQTPPNGNLLVAGIVHPRGDVRVSIIYPNGRVAKEWTCDLAFGEMVY